MDVTRETIRAEETAHPFAIREFTDMDRVSLPMVIRGTWVFGGEPDLDRMRAGLRQLLRFYPHLAGRMRDKRGIHLTNDGVPFIVAEDPISGTGEIRGEDAFVNRFSKEIKPSRLRRGREAPLSVQITKLKDGFVLGIRCSHACLDGGSFYTMVYNWAQICKNEAFQPPVLDQSLLRIRKNLSREQVLAYAQKSGWKRISTLSFIKLLPAALSGLFRERSEPFYFSRGALEALEEKIEKEIGFPCSTNVALSAFLAKMSMELYRHREQTECVLVTVVDLRKFLSGIPSGFAGNASTFVTTEPFRAGSKMGEIAKRIYSAFRQMLQDSFDEDIDFLTFGLWAMRYKLPYLPFDLMGLYSKKPTVIYSNNFAKVHVYDIDFGTGGALYAIPHNLTDQILIWPAPPGRGGLEIFFSGVPARRIRRRKRGDPWFREMKKMEEAMVWIE